MWPRTTCAVWGAIAAAACADSTEKTCPGIGCPTPVMYHSTFETAPDEIDVTVCKNGACSTKTLTRGLATDSDSASFSSVETNAECHASWTQKSSRLDVFVDYPQWDVNDSNSYRVAIKATGTGDSLSDLSVHGPFEVRALCGGGKCYVVRFGNEPPK